MYLRGYCRPGRHFYLSITLFAVAGIVLFSPWALTNNRIALWNPRTASIQDTVVVSHQDLLGVAAETTHPARKQIHGFTLLDQLYMWNGTFYIVTSNVSAFPERRVMIARPVDRGLGLDDEPTDTVSHIRSLLTHSSYLIVVGTSIPTSQYFSGDSRGRYDSYSWFYYGFL